MNPNELCALAEQARARAYCPYSHFAVGAALLCADGRIFTGCNIENAAFGPSICAERTAVSKAVSEGAREFSAIAIAGGPAGAEVTQACPPCGVCRQVLREFCPDELAVYLSAGGGTFRATTLGALLPESFCASAHLSDVLDA